MDIVADKKSTLESANKIANILIEKMVGETKGFQTEDDPAEYIYISLHILGNIISKIIISLEGYSSIYGIDKLTSEFMQKFINEVSLEYMSVYKKTNGA
jgi:hypothetical protein